MQTETVWRGTAPAIHRSIDFDLYFRREARREPRYAGQNNDAFQAALAAHHGGVRAEDCDFYHVVELDDGRRFGGEWDLRGHEDYLGGESLTGQRVVEFGPASGWLSQHIARRAAALTSPGSADSGPPPTSCRSPASMPKPAGGAVPLNFVRLRNSWWFTRRMLGFSATAIYADIYDPPTGPRVVRRRGLRLRSCCIFAHPIRALQRAAERHARHHHRDGRRGPAGTFARTRVGAGLDRFGADGLRSDPAADRRRPLVGPVVDDRSP